MAYAALLSLSTTIEYLLNSSRISIIPPCPEIKDLYYNVHSLLQLLRRTPSFKISSTSERVIADLDRRTIEVVWKFEDALECHVSNQLLSQFESLGDHESYPLKLALHLQEVEQEIDLFTTAVVKIKEEYSTHDKPLVSDDDDDGDVFSSSTYVGRSGKERSEMAYAALISLMETIECLTYYQISLVSPCLQIGYVYEDVGSLQVLVDRSSSSKSRDRRTREVIADLDKQIIEASLFPSPQIKFVYKDLGSLQVLLERSSRRSQNVIPNLDRWIKEATCKLNDALESCVSNQFHSQSESLGDEIHPSEVTLDMKEVDQEIDFFTTTVSKIKEEYNTEGSKMVGLHDELNKLNDRLIIDTDNLRVVPVVGMVGIGKTTLATKVYEDPIILKHFQRRAWVTVGPKYQLEKIMSDLLDQLSPCIDEESGTLGQGDSDNLYESLRFKRYLIVFDDTWETEVWHKFKPFFPDDNKGSRILLTTRLEEVANHACTLYRDIHRMRFLNNEESGLPFAIIIVGNHLSKSEKTLEYWTNVAEKRIPVFDFFPQDSEITVSKLSKLWCAEGLIEPKPLGSLEYNAKECLEDLVSKNVVVVRRRSSYCGTKMHSLLCTGPKHQYSVPMCFNFSLIKVLDALTIRFYKSPFEILKLVQLRYLAFTYNGDQLPAAISKLWDLQYLIVHQHLSIKSSGTRSYFPIEIWNMKGLRHLQVMGSDLPDPPCDGCLPKLSRLLDGHFRSLERLLIRHCYNLKEVPSYLQGLEMIELVGCNPSATESAKKIKIWHDGDLKVSVHFSGDDSVLMYFFNGFNEVSVVGNADGSTKAEFEE
ncbi:hypothetical protein BUALT_Bualt07G0122100 [Buddleja alternifolia]|uniref:NB-ARC domain-containing protein n=1 Tax=Buddleja alternifolia TaxID=168488 RepID=A0AAV6XGN3_9LAMI|nr:hypothetical protein BUALT_Bualt07G0122100 [Buddleja alternifolia]